MLDPTLFAVIFPAVLTVMMVTERLVNAGLYLVISAIFNKNGGGVYPAMQFYGAAVGSVFESLSTVLDFASAVLRAVMGSVVWGVIFFSVVTLVFLFYEYSPGTVREFVREWNRWIGPMFYFTVIWPLRLFVMVFENVLPVFNFVVRIWKNVFFSVSMTAITQMGAEIADLAMNVGVFAGLFTQTFLRFVNDMDNKVHHCADVGRACLELTEWDLEAPVSLVSPIARNVVMLATGMCPIFAMPLDLILYPLMDPNLPSVTSGLVNFFIKTFVETPRVTAQRCRLHRADIGVMACIPDLQRVYEHYANMVRTMAQLIDNWLDMSLVILEAGVNMQSPVCAETEKRDRTIEFSQTYFAKNVSTIVALSQSVFAITDGATVQYVDSGRTMESVISPLGVGWPIQVDASLGVAAIDGLGGGSRVSLLGCRCEDIAGQMRITCAEALHYEDQTEDAPGRVIDVMFQVPGTASVMTCATSKISVQSVRWPSVRYTAVNEAPELVAKRRVDAAVWVMPLCLGPSLSCAEDAIVTSCYPYCLALHERASPSRQMVLYDAEQWEEYVHLMGRDCTIRGTGGLSVTLGSGVDSGIKIAADVISTFVDLGMVSSMVNAIAEGETKVECVSSQLAHSVIPTRLHASYAESQNSVRTSEQPFVVAGDVALVGNYDFRNHEFSVTALRIYGNSRNEFTMQRIADGIPANPPVETLESMATFYAGLGIPESEIEPSSSFLYGRITLPYRFSSSAFGLYPAVQTRDGVAYATNPTLHTWTALFEYCRYDVGRTQIMVLSSFHALTVTVVTVGVNKVELAGVVLFDQPGDDPMPVGEGITADMCSQLFSVAVTGMEVLDDMNIAVSVLYTTVEAGADPFTDPRTRTRIFYINALTLEKRENQPWDTPLPRQPSDPNIQLCPALRRMPQIGSMFGEWFVALGVLVKIPLDTPLVIVGLVPHWSHTVACPLESYGHTGLQRCGDELFSFVDELFEAVTDSNGHYWRSLVYISNMIPFHGVAGNSVKGALTGTYYLGNNRLTPFVRGTLTQVIDTGKFESVEMMADASEMGMGMFSPVNIFGSLQGAVMNPITWAWFAFRVLTRTLADLIPAAVHGDVTGSLDALWENVYESRGTFSNMVIKDGMVGCSGMGMVYGGSNPFARFLVYGCEAPLRLVEGTLDFALTATVDTGFAACVCYGPDGHDFAAFVADKCLPSAPRHLQPVLINMINGFVDRREGCDRMREDIKYRLERAMDPTFAALYAASEQVGLLLDWFRTWIGQDDGGQCLNFDTDPYIAALIPEPVDYFRVCGQTEYCELRCAGAIANFDALLPFDGPGLADDVFSEQVEGLFFTDETASSHSSFRSVLALYVSAFCTGGFDASRCSRCVYVLGVQEQTFDIAVRAYCVPASVGAGVFQVSHWAVPGVSGQTASMGAFIDTTRVILVNAGDGGAVAYVGERLSEDVTPTVYTLRLPYDDVLRVNSLLVKGVNVFMHYVRSGGVVEKQCMQPILPAGGAPAYFESSTIRDCSAVAQVMYGHHVVWLGDGKALLIPSIHSIDPLPVRVVEINWLDPLPSVQEFSTFGTVRNFAVSSGVSDFYKMVDKQEEVGATPRILAQNSMSVSTARMLAITSVEDSTSRVNWLAEVRLDKTESGRVAVQRVFSRQETMTVRVERQCNRLSCSGCYLRDTQVACHVMHQCIVGSCVGTLVNQRRALCAIGMTIKAVMDVAIQAMQGSFMVVAQTAGEVLQLTLRDGQSFEATWPDEAFFGMLCVSKDAIAHATSIFTASVNNVLQTVLSIPYESLSGGAVSIDGNLRAVTTMGAQAMNQLLYQIAIGPLYVAIVVQKMVVCKTSSLLAFSDFLGVEVTFGSEELRATAASTMMQCVSDGVAVTSNSLSETGEQKGLAQMAADISRDFFAATSLGATTTTIDAVIAYAQGILTGMEDVAQTFDMARCKMPDFYMSDVFDCVCGDQPMVIPEIRSKEGISDSAFWCTGTLQMVGADGEARIVYNRHSLYDLEQEMGATGGGSLGASGASYSVLDKYLLCLARPSAYENEFGGRDDCARIRPFLPDLEMQGVDTIAVMGRCRANYHLKEWDPGAYALFSDSPPAQVSTHELSSVDESVGECLRFAHANRQGPTACLDGFLSSYADPRYPSLGVGNVSKELYFSYERLPAELHNSAVTDACEAFSGPARTNDHFAACMNEGGQSCNIAPIVWSARSNNRVPVAVQHKRTGGSSEDLYAEAGERLENARELLRDAFTLADEWSSSDTSHIKAALFSAEGDFLHQLFDCAFMGAMPRVDLWPLREQGLPVPSWWRNEDGTRLLRACGREELGDDDELPFTCGSELRRAVMKYFVRDYFFSSGGTANSGGIVDLVVERIGELKEDYGMLKSDADLSAVYACKCPAGHASGAARAFACCSASREDNYVPEEMRTARFDQISAGNIAAKLSTEVQNFWKEKIRSHDAAPWWKYLHEDEREALDWADTVNNTGAGSVAAQNGLFSSTADLLHFDASETKGPFVQGAEGLWSMCTGLLGQRMSTLPLKSNATGWFLKSTDRLRYDASQGDLRDFARNILAEIDRESPMAALRDWRHAPSRSAVCAKRNEWPFPAHKQSGPLSIHNKGLVPELVGLDDTLHGRVWGVGAHKLGDPNDCFCGWVSPDNNYCEMPVAIKDALKRPSTQYGRDKNAEVVHDVLFTPGVDLTGNCPYLDFSDHWGVLPPEAAAEWTGWTSTGGSIDAQSVIVRGRGGLRVEAWNRLVEKSNFTLEEADRAKKFQAYDGHDLTTQEWCVGDTAWPIPRDDVGFFPVVQIVQESMPLAACSRYVVEAAQYRLLVDSGVDSLGTVAQQIVVEQWETRCNAQLHLLSTCNHFDVLEFIPDTSPAVDCPFEITGGDPDKFYIASPGCIVFYGNSFYDPCTCMDCSTGTLTFNSPAAIPGACKLWFDPRSLTQGWGRSVPLGFVEKLMDRIRDDQEEGVTFGGQEYCDGFVDWWPENWEHPVGYHVTTPCHPDEAGYRVFDTSFRINREGASPVVEYEPDALRDPDLSAAHFGTGGLCRKTTYGFPLFELNDLRLCTRGVSGERFDPLSQNTLNQGDTADAETDVSFTPFVCADNAGAVPWHFERPLPAQYRSVGTVPALAGGRGFADLPLAGVVRDSGVSFYTRPRCDSDADCVGKCRRGVCYSGSAGSICVSHGDCPDTEVCSADGACVPPVVYIQSLLEEDLDLEVFSWACENGEDKGEDAMGRSRWGQVRGLLPAHGFCGYHEWHDYREMCPDPAIDCVVGTGDVWKNSSSVDSKTVAELGLLHVAPHPCDFSYQRTGRLRCPAHTGGVPVDVDYIYTARPAAADCAGDCGPVIPIMADSAREVGGNIPFLGVSGGEWNHIARCADIPQCSRIDFTWNGAIANDKFQQQDTFSCGAGMNLVSGKCVFDFDVVPFATQLCQDKSSVLSTCNANSVVVDENALLLACALVKKEWDPDDIRVRGSASVINGMYAVFTTFQSTRSRYRDVVRCANALRDAQPSYDGVQSASVYYAFDYSLYEVPFSWWFKCSLLGNIPLSGGVSGAVTCDAWSETAGVDWWMGDVVYDYDESTLESKGSSRLEAIILKMNQHSDFVNWYGRSTVGYLHCYDGEVFDPEGDSPASCLLSPGDSANLDCYVLQLGKIIMSTQCNLAPTCDVKRKTNQLTYYGNSHLLEALRGLGSVTYLGGEYFTGDLDKDREIGNLVAQPPGDGSDLSWGAWVAENLPVIKECRVADTFDYYTHEAPEGAVDFMSKDDASNFVLSRFFPVYFPRQGGHNMYQPFGQWAGFLSTDFVEVMQGTKDTFVFGSVRCAQTYGTNGPNYEEYQAWKMYDDETLGGDIDKSLNGARIKPCHRSLVDADGKPQRNCKIIDTAVDPRLFPDAKQSVKYRFECKKDETASPSTPAVEVLDFTNEYGEEFYAFVPKAMCTDFAEVGSEVTVSLASIVRQLNTKRTFQQFSPSGTTESVGMYDHYVTSVRVNDNLYPDAYFEGSGCVWGDGACECHYSAEEPDLRDEDLNSIRARFWYTIPKVKIEPTYCTGLGQCKWCDTVSSTASCFGSKAADSLQENERIVKLLLPKLQEYVQSPPSNWLVPSLPRMEPMSTSKIYSSRTNDFESAFKFDTSMNRVHDYFLRKDMNNQVMCREGAIQDINYNKCGYHERLNRLRGFVGDKYTEKSKHHRKLSTDATAEYRGVDLKRGAVIAWTVGTPPESHLSRVFGEGLERGDCPRGVESILSSYCYVEGEDVTPMNPWLGGDYNPIEGCDTYRQGLSTEVIDGGCDVTVCPTEKLQQDFVFGSPASQTCHARDAALVSAPRIAEGAPNNLCQRAAVFEEEECPLGGGLPAGGGARPAADLYDAVKNDFVCSGETVRFFTDSGVSPLFSEGSVVEDACLQFGSDEMGPVAVWLRVGPNGWGVAYQAQVSDPEVVNASKKDSWVYSLAHECAADLERYESIYGGAEWTATGPYERIAFWQGLHEREPVWPDPSRSSEAFSGGGCSGGAHPLQAPQEPLTPVAAPVRTADGLCFCATAEMCLLCVSSDRVSAFTVPGGAGARSETQVPESTVFADFPCAGGVYRDDSASAHTGEALDVGVVSRLPAFSVGVQKTDVPTRARKPGAKTTLSEGGVCHMGRGVSGGGAQSLSSCELVERTAVNATFECGDGNGGVVTRVLQREASKTPLQAAAAKKTARRKCGQCSVPGFSTTGGLDEAESSFGVPFRFAPSRRVMRELQEIMADYGVTSDWGLPSDKEKRKTFVNVPLREAARRALGGDASETVLSGLRALFDEAWVFCNETACSGSIPYDDWAVKGPLERIQQCEAKLLAESNNGADLVVEMELCDLDSTMDEFCSAVRAGGQEVFNANCHAAGLCVADTFVYTPAVYSVSNNDFVRVSVENFYKLHDESLCPAADADEEHLRAQNVEEQRECASTYINIMTRTLGELRQVVHTIARASLYWLNVVISLFRTVLALEGGSAMSDLIFWFKKLTEELKKIMLELAQLIFRLTFNMSTFGQTMRDAIKKLCYWVTWVLDKVSILWCNVVDPVVKELINIVNVIVTEIENAINSIPLVSGFKFFVLRNVVGVLEGFLGTLKDIICTPEPFPCDWGDTTPDDIDAGEQPAATRCWADFVPFAGIASSLACSRSDTCVLEDLDSEKVVCDACPIQDGVTFNDYGCNLVTKRCTCKTQPRTMTYCSESAQCSLDATCLLVDDPFASAVWGVDLCSACSTGPVCVFDGSESIGKCACPFTSPRVENCDPAAIGDTVFIQPTTMAVCYYTFSRDIETGATTTVAPDALAVVPCSIVDPTAVVCVDVGSVPSVVAFRLSAALSPGRRLLALPLIDFVGGGGSNQELADAIVMFSDWNRTAEPCRSLSIAHRREVPLGPVDTFVLQHCVFWRMVGNMTPGVPDTLFLSLEDAIAAVSDDPAVLMRAFGAIGETLRAVLALWPAARNFLAHVAPLIDGRNDSWLALAHRVVDTSATPIRASANWDAYKNFSLHHGARRLMSETPRLEDLTEATISTHEAHVELRTDRVIRDHAAGKISASDLGGVTRSSAIFSATGIDDFLNSRQEDPSMPSFEYWLDMDADGVLDWNTCPAVAIAVEEVMEGLSLLKRVYSEGAVRIEPNAMLNLSMALPRFVSPVASEAESSLKATKDTVGTVTIGYVARQLEQLTGLTGRKLAGLVRCSDDPDAFSLCNMLRSFFKCDEEAVQLCSRRTHSVYLGIPVCIVIFMVLSYCLSTLGLGSFIFWMWLTFPGFLGWYTYGYSPSCMPMVPTCLAEDVILPLYYFLPRRLRVSEAMQTVPGCWDDDAFSASECFRSCASDPMFNYQSLSATYAQLACEYYGAGCYKPRELAPPEWMQWLVDPREFESDLYYKYLAQWNLFMGDPPREDELVAQRFCMFVGLVYTAPYVVLGSVLFLVLVAIPALLFRLLFVGVQLLMQMVFYSHMSVGGDI